jgi:hypothetical protein
LVEVEGRVTPRKRRRSRLAESYNPETHLMLNSLLALLVLSLPPSDHVTTCPENAPTTTITTEVMCAQIAAAARLRVRAGPPRVETLADSPGSVGDSQGSVGKGALIGLVVGLGLGVVAAVVVAPGCEENQGQCGLMFVVGGSALGAGIGALVGAASGPD